jgi:hypothetical protein
LCSQSPLGVLKNGVLYSTLCIVERGSNNSREARRVITALLTPYARCIIISERYLKFAFSGCALYLNFLPSYKVLTCYTGSHVWFHLLHFTLATLAQNMKISTR